jgi:hypothetical protein
MVVGSGSLQGAPGVECEAVRVMPKLQWRPQAIGDSKNMKYLQRKATGNR